MSSREVTIVWAQPFARATSAFSSVLTVPIMVTPRARAHWQAIEADAAGGGVVQDRLAALERIDLAEQVLRRHALHHQRRGGAVGHARGQRDQHVGRHDADVGVRALRAEQVADAVAGADVGDAGADRFDDADGVAAEPVRQRHRIAAGAEVDVDEVDGDVAVAHARLAGAGLADVDRLELEHLGAAGLAESNRLGHDLSLVFKPTARR